jgi:cytidylate kinase
MAVITISRQYGSEGLKFAKELSDVLNYKFVYKDIYKQISESKDISINELKALESLTSIGVDFFQKLIDSSYISRIIGKKNISYETNEFISLIETTIKEFAKMDNIVIVGRASQCVLRDYPKAYHIRIVKEFNERVNYLVNLKGVSREAAESTILRKDKERESYIKKFYNAKWDAPELYHLTINLSRVSFDEGILIIKGLIS